MSEEVGPCLRADERRQDRPIERFWLSRGGFGRKWGPLTSRDYTLALIQHASSPPHSTRIMYHRIGAPDSYRQSVKRNTLPCPSLRPNDAGNGRNPRR